jgi:hypothetical protein
VLPLAVFAASRVIDGLVIAHAAHHQIAMDGSHGIHVETSKPADPGYLEALTNWDGQWYETIALHGYPSHLSAGLIGQTPWAFFPVYPLSVRLVMILTPLGFDVAASLVSLVCAGLGVVLLYRLIEGRGHRSAALTTVAGLCFFPSAPILQAAYTEGLTLLELVVLLGLLTRRRYGPIVPLLLLVALTRPVALALVPLIVLHAAARWRGSTRRQRWQLAGLTALAGASSALWPALAGILSGRADVYFATERAWGNNVSLRQSYLGWLFGSPDHATTTRALLVFAVLAVTVVVPAARAWPLELRIWALVYGAYLALTLRPSSSIERYMLLALVPWLPLPALAPAGTRRWVQAVVLAVVGLIGLRMQVGWVGHYLIPSDASLLPP